MTHDKPSEHITAILFNLLRLLMLFLVSLLFLLLLLEVELLQLIGLLLLVEGFRHFLRQREVNPLKLVVEQFEKVLVLLVERCGGFRKFGFFLVRGFQLAIRKLVIVHEADQPSQHHPDIPALVPGLRMVRCEAQTNIVVCFEAAIWSLELDVRGCERVTLGDVDDAVVESVFVRLLHVEKTVVPDKQVVRRRSGDHVGKRILFEHGVLPGQSLNSDWIFHG